MLSIYPQLNFSIHFSDKGSVAQTAERVFADVGPVDILINNAGIVSGKLLTDLTEDNIRRTFDVNVMAHFWVRSLRPVLVKI